jgi:hypothetical protein
MQKGLRCKEASDVIPMLPTFVWKVQVEASLRDALREKILAALAGVRARRSRLEPGQGWQSEQALQQREAFRDLVACITDGVANVLRFLRIGNEHYEITGCWATAENTDQVVIRVRDGTLLMLPSYLEHSVDANAGDEERISVSFNVMFSSFAERLSKPLW